MGELLRSGSGILMPTPKSGGGAGDRISFIDQEGGEVAFLISDAPTENSLDGYVKVSARPRLPSPTLQPMAHT
jgi:hypothetical protein